MIDESEVVFVGEVVAMTPNDEFGALVAFRVDQHIRGNVGERVEAVTEMNSCTHPFRLGDHAIFAGDGFAAEGVGTLYFATDSGWDPTVILNDPPTADQLIQLNYLNKLAEEQAAEGTTK